MPARTPRGCNARRGAPRAQRSLPGHSHGPTDALCRQKSFQIGRSLLFRESEQRRREGSRHASASHGTATTTQFRTRTGPAPVPVEGPTQIHQRGEELCNPSAAGSAQAPHTRAAKFARARPTAPFAWNGRLACWSNAHGHPALHPCMNHHASHTHLGAHASCSQEQSSGSW